MSAKVQHERGAWWLVVHAGRQRTKRRFGPTKADRVRARKAAEEINHRLALGLDGPLERRASRTPTFGEAVRRWHTTYSPTFKLSYRATSTSSINRHLLPFFGAKHLDTITRDDVLDFIKVKLEQELKPGTIMYALVIVRRVLNLAVEDGTIGRNPARRIGELLRRVEGAHATEVRRVESWTRTEVETLLEVAREHEPRFYPALLTLLSTGIRRGELLGLKWEDINLEDRVLSVRRAIVRGALTTPKNRKGREVPISQGLASALAKLLEKRRQECLARGWPELPEWVFCSQTGGPLEENNFSRTWKRVRRRAHKQGVRPLRLHSTRHTSASLALHAGRSIRWVADVLGHADPSLTLRQYAHALRSSEDDLSFAEFGAAQTAPDGTIRHQHGKAILGSKRVQGQVIEVAREFWSGRPDSNRRLSAPKADALPGCATPRSRKSLAGLPFAL